MKKVFFFLSLFFITGIAFAQADTSAVLSGIIKSKAADATIVSTVWSQVEGKSANIISANNLQTKVTGLTAGIYKFRLTITDNFGLSGTKDVTVEVIRYNEAPVADASESRIVIQLRK